MDRGRSRRITLAACVGVMVAAAGWAAHVSVPAVTSATSPTRASPRAPDAAEGAEADLAEEEQEAAETAEGRRAAIRSARAEGEYGRTGPFRHIPTPGWAR